MARAQQWVDAKIPYCQCSGGPPTECCGVCPYCNDYRCDCSGYVSFTWELGSGYTTSTLPEVSGGAEVVGMNLLHMRCLVDPAGVPPDNQRGAPARGRAAQRRRPRCGSTRVEPGLRISTHARLSPAVVLFGGWADSNHDTYYALQEPGECPPGSGGGQRVTPLALSSHRLPHIRPALRF